LNDRSNIVLLMMFVFIQTQVLFAQSKIKLVDENTNEAIFLAHVKFSNLKTNDFKWAVSDEQGIALNPYNDSTQVDISFTGYEKKTILIKGNETLTVKLKSTSFGLKELVVTANFVPIQLNESVYKIETIREEKIISKGASNLREILNTELNFRTNNGHVNETSINLNGLSGNHVKFMIDGVPVEGRLNGNIDISQINMNNVEKIEIIDGPTSVAYGTNALGGTINIITKKTQAKKLNIQAKSYYESIGQYNFSTSIGFKHKKNTYKISGGRNFFGGFATPDTSRFKTWKPREQYVGSFILNRTIKHLKFTYILDAFTETMTDRGLPRAPYNISAFDTYNKTQRINNKILLNGRISPTYYIDITLAHSYFKRTRNIYFKDLTTLEQFVTESDSDQDTTVFNSYLARTVFIKKNDSLRWNYSIGTELKYDKIEALRVENKIQNIGDYALFASLDYKLMKLTIRPSVRYSYNTSYSSPIVPSVNLLYAANENLQFRTSFAKGFRAPDLKELYLEFHFNSSINLWGNPNLKAENSDHINISMDWNKKIKHHSFKISPKLYYSKINNLISLVKISDVDWKYNNVDYLTTYGGALNIQNQYKNINLAAGINYFGNYNSMFDNTNLTNSYFYTTDLNTSLSYKIDSLAMSINLTYKYTGKIKNLYLLDDNEVATSFIGNFSTFDASIVKYFYNRKINAVLGVKNIFNVTQVDMVGDVYGVSNQSNATSLNVLWGRSFFVALNFNF